MGKTISSTNAFTGFSYFAYMRNFLTGIVRTAIRTLLTCVLQSFPLSDVLRTYWSFLSVGLWRRYARILNLYFAFQSSAFELSFHF
jgi:hypothetical protein